jgi:hypothetical protein
MSIFTQIEETAKVVGCSFKEALVYECLNLQALATMLQDKKLIAQSHLLAALAADKMTRPSFEAAWACVK